MAPLRGDGVGRCFSQFVHTVVVEVSVVRENLSEGGSGGASGGAYGHNGGEDLVMGVFKAVAESVLGEVGEGVNCTLTVRTDG